MQPSAPFPAPAPPGAGAPSPGYLAAIVARLLARHGLTRVYTAACQVFAVISVTLGLTVWTNGSQLWWDEHGQSRAWPAADPEGAAAHLAGLAGRTGRRPALTPAAAHSRTGTPGMSISPGPGAQAGTSRPRPSPERPRGCRPATS